MFLVYRNTSDENYQCHRILKGLSILCFVTNQSYNHKKSGSVKFDYDCYSFLWQKD